MVGTAWHGSMTLRPPDPSRTATRRLVVVDDDRLFLDVFSANLRTAGYEPVCFDDPQAALTALRNGTTACACVVDLDMRRPLTYAQMIATVGVPTPPEESQ